MPFTPPEAVAISAVLGSSGHELALALGHISQLFQNCTYHVRVMGLQDSVVDSVSLWLPRNTQHGMLHRVFIEEINQLETQKEVSGHWPSTLWSLKVEVG